MGTIMKEETGLERRTFLKGALVASAAAGITTLTGCSQSETASSSSAAGTTESKTHSYSWENPPAAISESSITDTTDVDVLIIGAGMAGMAAFMSSAESGASTAIIEKAKTYSARGLDFAAIDTKIQKAAGIEIDKGLLVSDLIKSSGLKANGSLIKLWADHSGDVFDRLIDMTIADGGEVTLGSGSSASANAEDFTTKTYPTDHEFGAVVDGPYALVGRMEKAGIEAGGTSYYNTKAEQLVRADNGLISGAIASTEDGSYIKFNVSKGVILATGDYGNNDEMLEAWSPLLKKAAGNVYPNPSLNTGDGINMACWVGGTVQPGAHAAMVHPIFGGGALSTASYMKVNNTGVRFCSESTTLPGISNMYMTSPQNEVWTIFDSDYDNQMPKMSPLSNYNNNTAGPLTKLFSNGQADPTNPPSNSEVITICEEEGTTIQADTLSDLAEKIGIPADKFVETVARYNELVDAGVDEDYGKEAADLQPIRQAPFYASTLTAQVLVVTSGLNVNANMQVLDAEDAPIENLYAVGNVMGNFFANDYPICAPGLSHGRCLTLGSLIGQAVATDTKVQD